MPIRRFFTMRKEKKSAPLAADLQEKPFFKDKKNVLRLVLAAIALLIAVGAIVYGVTSFGSKKPGIQEIEASLDSQLQSYSQGIHFLYDCRGSSDQIKRQIAALQKEYEPLLKNSYMLLDPENTYEGLVNLATLNRSPEKKIRVDETLFGILRDADGKSAEKAGYSLYTGPAAVMRKRTLYAQEPEVFDPLNNASAAEFRQKVYDEAYAGGCSLTFDEKECAVTLHISDAYAELQKEADDAPALDTDLLKDAFRLQIVAQGLQDKGYTKGLLYSDSGVSVSLSEHGGTSYRYLSCREDTAYYSLQIAAGGGESAAYLRAFALGEEDGYYRLQKDGKTYLRHPYISDFLAEPAVTAAFRRCDGIAPADAAYDCLRVLWASSPKEAAQRALQPGGERDLCCFSADLLSGKIYANDVSDLGEVAEGFVVLPAKDLT